MCIYLIFKKFAFDSCLKNSALHHFKSYQRYQRGDAQVLIRNITKNHELSCMPKRMGLI